MGCGCHDHADEDPFAVGDEADYEEEELDMTWEGVGERLQDEFPDEFMSLAADSAAWLLAGVLLVAILQPVLQVVVGKMRHAAGWGVFGQAVAGAVAGVLLPCCSCGVLPIAAGVARRGAPVAAVAMAFVSSGAGVDSLIYTFGAWGTEVALARVGAVTVVGCFAAAAAGWCRSGAVAEAPGPSCCESKEGVGLFAACLNAFEDVLPSITLGLAVTAAYTTIYGSAAPASSETDAATRFHLLAASTPLQLCEYAVVHLCQALFAGGLSVGTVFAWLVIAPSTSVGWLGLTAQTLGIGAAVAATVFAVGSALALSYAVDGLAGTAALPTLNKQGLRPPVTLPPALDEAAPYALGALAAAVVLRRIWRLVAGPSGEKAKTD